MSDDPWSGVVSPFARDWDEPSYEDLAPTHPATLAEFGRVFIVETPNPIPARHREMIRRIVQAAQERLVDDVLRSVYSDESR